MKTKRVIAIISAAIMLVTALASCGKSESSANDKTETKEQTALFSTPRERLSQEPQDSPEWVTKLDAAKNAKQLFVVAGYERSTAWISMHEKDANGSWKMIMSTPGFIGKEGLGKTKEGDGMTPVGTFKFNKAFGIADDPGCAMDYTKADNDTYWSGDSDLMYNQMVSIKDYPDLKKMTASISSIISTNISIALTSAIMRTVHPAKVRRYSCTASATENRAPAAVSRFPRSRCTSSCSTSILTVSSSSTR